MSVSISEMRCCVSVLVYRESDQKCLLVREEGDRGWWLIQDDLDGDVTGFRESANLALKVSLQLSSAHNKSLTLL